MEAVDGGRVTCLGSSPVEVEHQGWTTQTRLLVEVIPSKIVLEALEVIDPDFPNAKIRSCCGLQASLKGTPGVGLPPEEGLLFSGSSPGSSMVSLGSLPKEDGNNSAAQSAMDLQGVEVERPDIHGTIGHVIKSLNQAEVESDKTRMENLRQSEVTMLNDHARCKE